MRKDLVLCAQKHWHFMFAGGACPLGMFAGGVYSMFTKTDMTLDRYRWLTNIIIQFGQLIWCKHVIDNVCTWKRMVKFRTMNGEGYWEG